MGEDIRPLGSLVMQKVESNWFLKKLESNVFKRCPYITASKKNANKSFTYDTLLRDGMIYPDPIVYSKLYFSEKVREKPGDGKEIPNELVAVYCLGENIHGYSGLVHGGAISTIFDDMLLKCCLPLVHGDIPIAVTRRLNITYNKPVPVESHIVIKTYVVKATHRRYIIKGTLELLSDQDKENPPVYAEALGDFIEPGKKASGHLKLHKLHSKL